MGGTTANRGYRYPASTDNTQIWSYIQNLASDVDVDVEALENAIGVWTTFTPTLWSNVTGSRASIAKVVNQAAYIKIGKSCWVNADVTASATSSSGAALGLPFSASTQQSCFGSAAIQGTSPPTQSGIAFMGSALDQVIVIDNTTGFCNITSGQRFRYSVFYQTA